MNEVIKKINDLYVALVVLTDDNKKLRAQLDTSLRGIEDKEEAVERAAGNVRERESKVKQVEDKIDINKAITDQLAELEVAESKFKVERTAFADRAQVTKEANKALVADLEKREEQLAKGLAQLKEDRSNYKEQVLEAFRKNVTKE